MSLGRSRSRFVILMVLGLIFALIPAAAGQAAPGDVPEVLLSEVRIDQPSDDNDEFFELAAVAGTSLDGLTYLVIGDGTGGSGVIEAVVDLSGQTVPSSGLFVAAESTFTLGTADLTTSLNFENSDNVTHLLVNDFTGANGDDLDTDDNGVLDTTPWSSVLDSVALVETVGSGELVYSTTTVGPDGTFVPSHAYVCDTWAIGSFATGTDDTPGTANTCTAPSSCGLPFTPIYSIQGSGSASLLDGSSVVTEGVVVGDFQDGKSGYFIQDAVGDSDAATSDGIFVYGTNPDVAVGDHVRVSGTVYEYYDLTEITAVSEVEVCGTGLSVAPTTVTLPVTSTDDFEAYEGMLVTFPQILRIAEVYRFAQYGEIVASTDRQFQPTAIYEPGSAEAATLAADNALARVIIDDGRSSQNPDPAIHPNGNDFSLTNLFQAGDTLQNVTGVVDYNYGDYKVQPTAAADYDNANPRPEQPDAVGGNLKVASFNVLNYFTTLDDGVNDICGPAGDQECRGADTAEEFIRQRDKIFSAMAKIGADVLGLMEIENNGTAVADLVDGLNAIVGDGTYAHINTGVIGTDAIAVAFIYKPETVSLVGDFAVLDDPAFLDPMGYGEDKNRPALAQSFMDVDTGGIFTAVVNHLKSKGSPCGDGDDDPEAGSCNLTRTMAAAELAAWLDTDPTGSGDEDVLILGDLNSYDKEDPIDALIAAGYTDLAAPYGDEYAYSYVFDGQLGYLDYAMANSALVGEVTGVTSWHINSDEANLIDYDMSYKKDAQDAIYAPDAYRSSDHDPVIVGLGVCDEIAPTIEVAVTPDMLWPPNHKYVDVAATVTVADNFDPNPTVTLVSVVSNEPDNGPDDGNTVNDIVIVDDYNFELRAERSGIGYGRFYTITYEATDACGNSTIDSAVVYVPIKKGRM